MVLAHCCHVFWKAMNLWGMLQETVSQVSSLLIHMTLARVNSLLKQKREEQPSKAKYCSINLPEDVAQRSKASRCLSSMEGIAEEQVIQAIQGGKRSWGQK